MPTVIHCGHVLILEQNAIIFAVLDPEREQNAGSRPHPPFIKRNRWVAVLDLEVVSAYRNALGNLIAKT